jgi:hypothetical protein
LGNEGFGEGAVVNAVDEIVCVDGDVVCEIGQVNLGSDVPNAELGCETRDVDAVGKFAVVDEAGDTTVQTGVITEMGGDGGSDLGGEIARGTSVEFVADCVCDTGFEEGDDGW